MTKQSAGRNELCPCMSGRKYKKCCLTLDNNRRKVLRVVEEIERVSGGIDKAVCFKTAKQITIYGAEMGLTFLYHEGTIHSASKGDIAHCWNSIDGMIVDTSNQYVLNAHGGIFQSKTTANKEQVEYESKLTLTPQELEPHYRANLEEREWKWVGDPDEYGQMEGSRPQ